MDFEQFVNQALDVLAAEIHVVRADAGVYTAYLVTGLCDTQGQREVLCRCMLGLIGGVIQVDLGIESAIGEGQQASTNLRRSLAQRLYTDRPITETERRTARDPLIMELLAHVLVHCHARRSTLPEWLGRLSWCSRPHLQPNTPGLDLIALGESDSECFVCIGEMKAWELNPVGALVDACAMFTAVREGDYNDEIRAQLQAYHGALTKQELANNVWMHAGKFGAVLGFDACVGYNAYGGTRRRDVLLQDGSRLYVISSPFAGMRELFDCLCAELMRQCDLVGE